MAQTRLPPCCTHFLSCLSWTLPCRSALHNFGALNDLYLPTNTLAALANLAPQVNGLHSHAAQRLVGLASSLGKRYLKLARQAEEAAALGQQTAPDELQVSEHVSVCHGTAHDCGWLRSPVWATTSCKNANNAQCNMVRGGILRLCLLQRHHVLLFICAWWVLQTFYSNTR